jgi:hypothetical protein
MTTDKTMVTQNAVITGPPGSRPLLRRGDGALLSPADLDRCVPIHRIELDELACLITLIEDWLLHTGDDVLAALARFAADRTPAAIIDDLGTQSVKLHHLIRSIS